MQEVLLAQFSLYVHKSDLKPDSFHLFVEVSAPDKLTLSNVSVEVNKNPRNFNESSLACLRLAFPK